MDSAIQNPDENAQRPLRGERRLLFRSNARTSPNGGGVRESVPKRFDKLYARQVQGVGGFGSVGLLESRRRWRGSSGVLGKREIGLIGEDEDCGNVEVDVGRRSGGGLGLERECGEQGLGKSEGVGRGRTYRRRGLRTYMFAKNERDALASVSSASSKKGFRNAKCEIFIVDEPVLPNISWQMEDEKLGEDVMEAADVMKGGNKKRSRKRRRKRQRTRNGKAMVEVNEESGGQEEEEGNDDDVKSIDKTRSTDDIADEFDVEDESREPNTTQTLPLDESDDHDHSIADMISDVSAESEGEGPRDNKTSTPSTTSRKSSKNKKKKCSTTRKRPRKPPSENPVTSEAKLSGPSKTSKAARALALGPLSICCFCPPLSFFDGDEMKDTLLGPFTYHGNHEDVKIRCHQKCACWAPQVHVDPDTGAWCRIVDEYKRGRSLKCVECKQRGATIGCFEPNCRKVWHYRCLRSSFANPKIIADHFAAFCSTHSQFANSDAAQQTFAVASERIRRDFRGDSDGDVISYSFETHYKYTKLLANEEEVLGGITVERDVSKLRKTIATNVQQRRQKTVITYDEEGKRKRKQDAPFMHRNVKAALRVSLRKNKPHATIFDKAKSFSTVVTRRVSPRRKAKSRRRINGETAESGIRSASSRNTEVPRTRSKTKRNANQTQSGARFPVSSEIKLEEDSGCDSPNEDDESTRRIKSATLPSPRSKDPGLLASQQSPSSKSTGPIRKRKLSNSGRLTRHVKRRRGLRTRRASRRLLEASTGGMLTNEPAKESIGSGLFSSDLQWLQGDQAEGNNNETTDQVKVQHSVQLPSFRGDGTNGRRKAVDWDEVFALDEGIDVDDVDNVNNSVLPAPPV